MAKTTARIQRHHITYEPEWVLEVKQSWHRIISRIQITKATSDQYRLLVNLQHAVNFECNRMRCELDICEDCRILNKKPKVVEKQRKEKVDMKLKTRSVKTKTDKKKKKKPITTRLVKRLGDLHAAAEEAAKRLDVDKKKPAATELRKVMQDVKNLAQEIRVKALEVQKKM